MKHLLVTALLISTQWSYAQVSENFDQADLSSGALVCWESDYASQLLVSSRVAAPMAQALSSDSRLSLHTVAPISGSASLRVTENINVPIYHGARSSETISSYALGVDGDDVSFKVRVNAATLPTSGQILEVIVVCGNHRDARLISAGDIGNTLTITSSIAGSDGGGPVKIEVLFRSFSLINTAATYSYSLDIDDFTTSADANPASDCANTLPVSLASFTARKTENNVSLDWTTTQETRSDRFEIQRSINAKEWLVIGTKRAAGETSGKQTYNFVDPSPLTGTGYYRLKMIDTDGSFAYSTIRNVDAGISQVKTVAYPNPTVDRIFLQDSEGRRLLADQLRAVSVHNAQGIEIYKTSGAKLQSSDGIDMRGFPSGLYLLEIQFSDGTHRTHPVLVKR